MRLISSKEMWYEEECVEYENEEEYKSDLNKRKHEYWMQMKIPDFENGKMKLPLAFVLMDYMFFGGRK